MDLTRRRLLATPVALGGAMAASGWLTALAAESAPMPDLSSWEAVRAQFTLDPALGALRELLHRQPPRAGARCDRSMAARDGSHPYQIIDEGLFTDEAHNIPLEGAGHDAHYLGGRAEDVALIRSTTEGLALIYHGLPLRAGDEVLVTAHDHFSHHVSAQYAARARGRDDAQESRCTTMRRTRASTA
jgi:hypothetical protein